MITNSPERPSPPEPEIQDVLSAVDHLMEYADQIPGSTERLAVVQLAKRLRAGAARPGAADPLREAGQRLLTMHDNDATSTDPDSDHDAEEWRDAWIALRGALSRGAAEPTDLERIRACPNCKGSLTGVPGIEWRSIPPVDNPLRPKKAEPTDG